MGDESAAPERALTELFNGGSQPLVIEWGKGTIGPGESFKTDNPEGYAPDRPGSPWTTDAEAASALLRLRQERTTNPPDSSQDGQSAPQDARGVPITHMLAGAEVASPAVNLVGDELVDGQGRVIGHIVPEPATTAATDQAADAAQPQQEV